MQKSGTKPVIFESLSKRAVSTSCHWCGSSDGELKTITVETPTRLGASTKEETVSVHAEHEEKLRAFNEKTRALGKRFLILALLFGAVLPMVGAGLLPLVSGAVVSSVIGVSTVAPGVVLYLYPFATPETIEMFGVKKSVRLVRGLAIGIVPLRLWILRMGLR